MCLHSKSISGLENQTCEIYHLLRATFGQRISVAKIDHLDFFNEVAILLIYVSLLSRW